MYARLAIVGMLLVGSATAARAQQIVAARASVAVASPTGAGTRNLAFGVVMPGAAVLNVAVPAAVAPQSATVHSGEFRFNVASSRGLSFSMTTPTQLTSGAAVMPVTFNGTQYGAWCARDGAAGTCTLTAFNPTAAVNLNVCAQTLGNGNCHPNRVFAANSQLSVYVGGMLSVPPGTRAGTYTATVTLNITQVY